MFYSTSIEITSDNTQSNCCDNMRAEEAIEQLRESICAPARLEEGIAPSAALSGLHPLACSSTGLARRRIRSAISALRTSLQAREQWDQRPEMREELLHVLRDTDKKRKSLEAGRTTLQKCLELARTRDPFASPCATAAACILSAAKRAGAITHEDASPGNKGPVVSVCGHTFLGDFQLRLGERRADVKFRDVDADGTQAPSDHDVDKDYALLVASGEFKLLERAFRNVVQLEALDAALGDSVPLRKGLRAFENDILLMQQAEIAAGCSPDVRLQQGHGIAVRCAHGLRIVYAKECSALLSVEDAPERRRLVVGASSPSPDPSTRPPRFMFATPHSVAARAHYTLLLDKPIPVTLKVALELERVAASPAKLKRVAAASSGEQSHKRDYNDDPFTGPFPSSSVPQNMTSLNMLPGHVDTFPSIQILLAPKVFGLDDDENSPLVDAPSVLASAGIRQRENTVSFLGSRVDTTNEGQRANKKPKLMNTSRNPKSGSLASREYLHCVTLPGGQYIKLTHSVASLVPGVSVTKVPVGEPGDLYRVFSILRQQIAFNALFDSCFGNSSDLPIDSTPLVRELVEIGLSDAPEFMQVNVFDPRFKDFVGLGISISSDGSFSAKLTVSQERAHPCSDEKASEILRSTRNVPITVQAIIQSSRM